jgi:phenylalanyl-tRNA synthetase alpha chain
MSATVLSATQLARALSVRDLADPAAGPHAMQRLAARIRGALERAWGCAAVERREGPIVTVAENYDALHYPPGGAARDARYTRYVTPHTLLRTQTTAMIPPLLRELAAHPPADVLLLTPGLVYRRDTIDRLHTGEPHQMDAWRIAARPLGREELRRMAALAIHAVLPGAEHRLIDAVHPYTVDGLQIDVLHRGAWVEVGECGLALPALLREAGLDTDTYHGLAMGLGLDRLLMLAKGIDDIRLLRSADPRVAGQMLDLEPYRPVSNQPPVRRDLSIAVPACRQPEELGDRVRAALGDRARALEAVEVMAETPYDRVPPVARERIGMRPGQKNVLVRVVIRDLDRTLTRDEANALRDAVYAAVHEGDAWQWASAAPPG